MTPYPRDERFRNARQNADETNARLESDRALAAEG